MTDTRSEAFDRLDVFDRLESLGLGIRHVAHSGETVTIPADYSAVVQGPFSVEDGGTLTVEDNARLTIL